VEACFETVVRESAEGELVLAAWTVGNDGAVELCETREILFGEIETEQLRGAWFGLPAGCVGAASFHGGDVGNGMIFGLRFDRLGLGAIG
jgi:hypothetical protein